MSGYTNVSKPSGSTYTNVNVIGKQTFDDITFLYDDSTIAYDGAGGGAYTNISKPVSSGYTNIAKPT